MSEQNDTRILTGAEARSSLIIGTSAQSKIQNPKSKMAGDLADMPEDLRQEMEQVSQSRRDFMKVTGMAAMGAVIAGCTAQEIGVKPMLKKPEGITPGKSYDYASTCRMCSANCGTLMKVRDGRPIKSEGNPQHPMNRGTLCAQGQAQLWNLYNPDRLHGPWTKEEPDGWADLEPRQKWAQLDRAAIAALKGGGVRLLTGTINGPAAREVIKRFCAATGAKHVMYDAVSDWPIAAAHRDTHGVAAIPHYNFGKAEVVVSFGADFLGNWISGVEFARQWATQRDLRDGRRTMSRHVQFESRVSTTGACADERFRVRDAERGAVLVDLAKRLGGSFGEAGKHSVPADVLGRVAAELKAAGSRALVVCGGSVAHQRITNWINNQLGAYGSTLDLASPTQQKLGNDEELAALIKEMEGNAVKTLVVWGINPVFDLPNGAKFSDLLGKVANKVAIGCHADETTSECDWIAAEDDPNESWNDFEPQRGLFSLAQPTVRRLWDTRSGLQTLLVWAGDAAGGEDYRLFLKAFWEKNILKSAPWKEAVETGVIDRRVEFAQPAPAFRNAGATADVGKIASGDIEIVTFESYNLGDGRHANNGWLQELPDPLARVSWSNFAAIAPATMARLELEEGDLVEVKSGDATCKAPVVRAPGQAEDVVALPLGYGRTKAGRVVHGMGIEEDAVSEETKAIGDNAFPLLAGDGFGSVTKVGTYDRLALLQTHDSQEGRPLAKETALELWLKNSQSGNEQEIPPVDVTLWPRWEYKGHKWGLVVDLNLCTGCNACIVACSTENNVPVVGKDEVWRRREMHWIRIDRYFDDGRDEKGEAIKNGKNTTLDNPEVVFQPMMCQHCENAPCETVCPVIATSHSDEGLNIQTYNRCIGTRYCANNCPYKVRRFNWFTYKHRDLTMNLVLNPDLTVRSQGVMEKCSMCSQRIYEGKRNAALDNRKPRDGEIRTACQQTCPTQAITFGDKNDPNSMVGKLERKDKRNYAVIAEINTRPAVTYLTKVRNRPAREHEKSSGHEGHGH